MPKNSFLDLVIPISKIIVKKRIRQDKGDLSQLKESIQRMGLLNPIVVDENHQLIAGERRLMAIKELGWKKINVRIVKDPSQYFRVMMEFDENIYRKDFTPNETIKGANLKEKLRMKDEKNLFLYYWNLGLNWLKSSWQRVIGFWR